MYLFFLMISVFCSPGFQGRKQLIVTEQLVTVKGQTSLGGFSCDFRQVGKADTVNFNAANIRNVMEFQIPVKDFSCGNFLLNKDFRSTLKADEYPMVRVVVRNLREKEGKVYCHLQLGLVGKKLEFFDFILQPVDRGLAGELTLNFETLGLEPPSKLGGMIKVEDKLELELLLGI